MRRLLRSFRFMLDSLFGRDRKQAELDEEFQSHLEMRIEDLERSGMTREEAVKEARRLFGKIDVLKEETRDSWGTRVVVDLIRDIRYSARSLGRSKGFSIAVIATLALSIGVNTSVFSTIYSLYLKPSPFEDSDRIVRLFQAYSNRSSSPFENAGGWSQYDDFKEHADLFEDFALIRGVSKFFGNERLRGFSVTSEYFEFMGVRPVVGRFFVPNEVESTRENIAVISQSFWESHFAANVDVVGSKLRFLNEPAYTIIGVAPRSMEFLDTRTSFFIPRQVTEYDLNPERRTDGGIMWAKLKPGVSRVAAAHQLDQLEYRWYEEVANANGRAHFESDQPKFLFEVPNRLKDQLVLLQFGALMVLLVACVNVANLLLSRTNQRGHELSVRHFSGAGKVALFRLMLCESTLLTLLGTVFGVALTLFLLKGINFYLTALRPMFAPIELDGKLLLWHLGVAAIIALILGLTPIVLLLKSGLIQKVDSSDRIYSASTQARRASSALVVAQVAATFVLLVGAGLLLRSFLNVMNVDSGFDPSRVVTGQVLLRPIYNDQDQQTIARQQILESMEEIPGVEKVGYTISWRGVVGPSLGSERMAIRGTNSETGQTPVRAIRMDANREYLQTMGMRILEGRNFYPGESPSSASKASGPFIVDKAFVDQFLNDQYAVGREICTSYSPEVGPENWGTIVGVVNRANLEGLEKRDGLPVVYQLRDYGYHRFRILVKTERSAENVIRDMRIKLREFNPGLRLINASLLEKSFDNLHLERRGIVMLVSVFAGLAILLSSIGIYGVLAYDVQQRRHEIGIRSAIGASRISIIKMILQQGLSKTLLGLGLALPASLYLNRFLESRLFDVTALDFWTYATVFVTIFSVALIASFLPAKRSVRIDPIEALRVE